MHGLQELEAAKVVEVTRLSGTSAGAIAAALYAANYDFGVLRTRIRDNREKVLSHVPAGQGALGSLGVLIRLLVGAPIADLGKLRSTLGMLFKEQGMTSFRDLKKPLHIVCTDLTNAKTHVHEDDEDLIVNAILDSCSIPFYFRTWGKKGAGMLLVDGGLCENFPVDVLREHEPADGITVGVSFMPGPPGETPFGLLSFTKALLDASMSNSVRRAQRQLGDDRIVTLSTPVGTLDFKRAVSEGMDAQYDVTKEESRSFFTRLTGNYRQSEQVVDVGGAEPMESESVLQRVSDLFEAQHAHVKMRVLEARVAIRIGAFSIDAAGEAIPDELSYRLRFEPDGEPLGCVRVAILDEDTTTFLQSFRREVFDREGKAVKTIDLMARDRRRAPDRRAFLLFFDPPLRAEDSRGPYTLVYSHRIRGLMAPLVNDGYDSISVRTSRGIEPTQRIQLLAMVPNAFPGVTMKQSGECTAHEKGRPMTSDEIRLLDLPVDADHYIVGWAGTMVEATAMFAADIVTTRA